MTTSRDPRPAGLAAQDELRSPFRLNWDKATAPLEAIERGLYALADQVTGTVTDGGGEWILTVHPRASRSSAEGLEHQLRQAVNDQTLRLRIAERTDPIRNLVFAVAFSRASLPEDALSDEGKARATPDGDELSL